MITRSVDGFNDWQFGKGLQDYRVNIDAVTQNIKTRIQCFLNDCFFDVSSGVDWFTLLGNKSELAINLAITNVIYSTPYVTGIQSFSLNLVDTSRILTVTYVINTSFSNQSASGTASIG